MPGSRGRSEVRILFVFDPWRSAILLVAGDKAGSWDRGAYIGRVGLTQAQLAETMGATPGRVSQIERGELSTIEAIARYVQALGGRLDLVANFTDHTLTVTTTEAAKTSCKYTMNYLCQEKCLRDHGTYRRTHPPG